jgi:hypothetical protein
MNQKARDALVAAIPVGRVGVPEDIWLAVRFVIECDYFNGRTIDVDGGLSACNEGVARDGRSRVALDRLEVESYIQQQEVAHNHVRVSAVKASPIGTSPRHR